jgi:hypothetical protein
MIVKHIIIGKNFLKTINEKFNIYYMNKINILIGKTLDSAQTILRNDNYRIVSFNETNIITDDIDPNRYNLYMENDIIVDVKIF